MHPAQAGRTVKAALSPFSAYFAVWENPKPCSVSFGPTGFQFSVFSGDIGVWRPLYSWLADEPAGRQFLSEMSQQARHHQRAVGERPVKPWGCFRAGFIVVVVSLPTYPPRKVMLLQGCWVTPPCSPFFLLGNQGDNWVVSLHSQVSIKRLSVSYFNVLGFRYQHQLLMSHFPSWLVDAPEKWDAVTSP